MPKSKPVDSKEKALIQRYLVWCYKTTREGLDRIDRKYTQVTVDRFILRQIEYVKGADYSDYKRLVDDFKVYIDGKIKDGDQQKFVSVKGGLLTSNYLYLRNRLKAIELAIRHFLGPRMLAKIVLMYEEEMTRRILESREH